MEHRTQLHIMWMAALVGAIGCNTVGALPVSAFVPQRCSIPSRQVNLAHTPWNKDAQKARSHVVMVASARAQEEEQETIPKDDTFSLPGWWRELTYPGSRPSTTVAKTFKDFADRTGGIWRTRSLGFLPATMLAAPTSTQWIKKVEANNKLKTSWPKSAMTLVGEKSVLASDITPEQHESLRDLYLQTIGPATILSIQPLVEYHMERYMKIIEGYAETGEEFQLVPIMKELSLDVIVACFLGDVVTQKELEIIRNGFDIIEPGLVSIPRLLPWPLNRTPLAKMRPFNYGRALEAREVVSKTIIDIVDRRRKQLNSMDKWESKYVIDTVLEKQAQQWANGGPAEGEMEIDEIFIIDNIIISLLGGLGASITTTTRVVHLMTAPESKYAAKEIIDEVLNTDLKVGSESAGGLFASFPHVRSLTLESARLFPPIFGVLRKPVEDLNYNGYTLEKDSSILWSYLPSAMNEEFYPDPERACPFRFLKRGGPKNAGEPRRADEPGQPQPPMFGFGKHYCPGRELSKLETIMLIKKLFGRFNVNLVEGQNLKGTFVQNIPVGGLKLRVSKRTPSPAV